MNKIVFIFLSALFFNTAVMAQQTPDQQRQELEKERQQLKLELEEQQRLLGGNKKATKQSMAALAIVNNKINIQERVINNVSRDINVLDNTITKSQRDVRKLSFLLDTLKQEYANSMVYSYKNRSNADFLNFIFSATSFNDAIQRINYLKSYRRYRELQGQNILRTQGLLKDGIKQLGANKEQKDEVLQTQSQEMAELDKQQKEKNDIVAKLKAEGKSLNNQIAARKKQLATIKNAINIAIKKAQDDARAAERAAHQKELDRQAALKNTGTKTSPTTTGPASRTKPTRTETTSVQQQAEALPSAADAKLNADFIKNRGSLPWPVEKGYVITVFGPNYIQGTTLVEDNSCLTIGSDIGSPVKAIFDGEVTSVLSLEDVKVVVIKHGKYFSSYSNLSAVTVSKGDIVHTGQTIGKVAANDEGIGAIDLYIRNDRDVYVNPQIWLRHK